MIRHSHSHHKPPSPPAKEEYFTPGSIHQENEREIKFHTPPRFSIPAHLGLPLSPRVFTSTYYDSEQHRLGQLGFTLRKRVERGKGVWQLKIPSGKCRIELEIESGSRHVPGPFLDLLTAFFRNQEPVLLGKLRTWRTGVGIQKDGRVIAAVTRDAVALLQDHKIIRRFQETELELKEGSIKQLKPIRKILEKAGATVKPLQPKIFQALDLPYPLEFPAALPDGPPTELIRTRLHMQFRQMLSHDPGTRLGRDSEALHQMRVSTRRTRAILRAVRSFLAPEWNEKARQEVGWIGSLLGEVRDWDVLLEYFRREFSDLSAEDHQAFQTILKQFEDQRSIARARLLQGLRSERYLDLLNFFESSMTRLPFQPDSTSIPDLSRKAFHKLDKFVNATGCRFPPDDLHRTRILLKRARYTVELAQPFLGKKAGRFLRQAKRLQELLGHHQDAVVAEDRLASLKPRTRGTRVAFVCGVIVERLRNHRQVVCRQIPQEWKKLHKTGKKL